MSVKRGLTVHEFHIRSLNFAIKNATYADVKTKPKDTVKFRKQAPQTRNAKNPPLNRPSKYKPPGGLYLEIALKYKVKQSKNGKFPSNYKASPIDFETQISPVDKPLKKGLWKI